MSNPSEQLPVGVMMPVLNSRGELPRHLESMNEWLGVVSEVVVVDSFSEDGTLDYLKEHLRHPNVRFLEHPRGLYQSWNFGIKNLESEFFFVSTLGDTTTPATIRRLYDSARELGTDILISAPATIGLDGKPLKDKKWPVHELIDDTGLTGAAPIDGWQWLARGLVYETATLVGSSASNLYRTEFMQARPFPTDFGHSGDSAWAIEIAFDAVFGVEPRAQSTFWEHDLQSDHKRLDGTAATTFTEIAMRVINGQKAAGNPPPPALAGIFDDFEAHIPFFLANVAAKDRHRELRQSGTPLDLLRAQFVKMAASRQRKETRAFRSRSREALRAASRA